jgi:hypothetical protein
MTRAVRDIPDAFRGRAGGAAPVLPLVGDVQCSPPEHGSFRMKFPSQNRAAMGRARDVTLRRRWFANLLWRAFPGHSAREKAVAAAPVLGLSVKQVENLLNGQHDAKLGTILAVLAIAGAESVFEIIGGPA